MFEPLDTVLVVDPEKPVREALKVYLQAAGYSVATAEDGVEAGKLILQTPPALLVTDVGMPYLSGVELVAALRADPALAAIPVIFLSGRGEPTAEEKRLRPVAWLKKPVNPQRLLDAVALHLLAAA